MVTLEPGGIGQLLRPHVEHHPLIVRPRRERAHGIGNELFVDAEKATHLEHRIVHAAVAHVEHQLVHFANALAVVVDDFGLKKGRRADQLPAGAWRQPGKKERRRGEEQRSCGAATHWALPWPLVLGRVAVALPGPVRGETLPGPAVVPVVEGAEV